MVKHGKILVPTDFSDASGEALRRACVLAQQFSAEIYLLHIVEPVVFFDTDLISISPLDEITEALRKGAEKRLRKQAEMVDMDVRVHLEEAVGEPSRAICTFAGELPADLIVIGRHGVQGTLEHLLIGSTAERVVRHAGCSVLVTMPHGFPDVES